MRSHRFIIITAAVMVLASASWAGAAGPPFELSVKKDQLIGSSRGSLRFTEDGVQYDTTEKKDARTWVYGDIKQLQVLSPTRIAVLTYEDQGRLKLGADRTFTFDVVEGSVSPELVGFLLSRVERPLVTAVMPPGAGPVLFRLPVKYGRSGRGSEGSLVMDEDHLAYLTERETDARYWRFSDLFAVLPLDPFRLQVQAYEGGSGGTRTFVFELKTDLPDGFYEALWARVNPVSLDVRPPRRPQLATQADGNTCGRRLPSTSINVVQGGCNPAPLERVGEGDQIAISAASLEVGAAYRAVAAALVQSPVPSGLQRIFASRDYCRS